MGECLYVLIVEPDFSDAEQKKLSADGGSYRRGGDDLCPNRRFDEFIPRVFG
jgi:hypothetical protein